MKRAGLSDFDFEAWVGDERVATFDHPEFAYVHAQDYRRMVRRLTGGRVRLIAKPRASRRRSDGGRRVGDLAVTDKARR